MLQGQLHNENDEDLDEEDEDEDEDHAMELDSDMVTFFSLPIICIHIYRVTKI